MSYQSNVVNGCYLTRIPFNQQGNTVPLNFRIMDHFRQDEQQFQNIYLQASTDQCIIGYQTLTRRVGQPSTISSKVSIEGIGLQAVTSTKQDPPLLERHNAHCLFYSLHITYNASTLATQSLKFNFQMKIRQRYQNLFK